MIKVRPFEQSDIPGVRQLHGKAFQDAENPPSAYFEEFFFRSPCADPDIRPLVYEADDGRIAGFLGVLPRRFSLRGRTVSVAMAAKFMVDPAAQSPAAGLALCKTFLAGPQDLSVADTANLSGRTIWHAFGSQTIWQYGFNWRRTLKPSISARVHSALNGGRTLRFAGTVLRPILPVLDAVAERRLRKRFAPPALEGSQSEIKPAAIIENMNEIMGSRRLVPDYEPEVLCWLIRRAAAKSARGELRTNGVWDCDGVLLGWYIYYLKPRGTANVLQLVARPHAAEAVLQALMQDAWQGNATAVAGRVEPALMQVLSQLPEISCRLSPYWMIAHAKDPELLAVLHRGEALLSRLDGEWSMAFHGEEVR